MSIKKVKKSLEKRVEVDKIINLELKNENKIEELEDLDFYIGYFKKIVCFLKYLSFISVFVTLTLGLFYIFNEIDYLLVLSIISFFILSFSFSFCINSEYKLYGYEKKYKQRVLLYGNDLNFLKDLSFKYKKRMLVKNKFINKLENSMTNYNLNEALDEQSLLNDSEFAHLEYLIHEKSLKNRNLKINSLRNELTESLLDTVDVIKIS